ncbi:MULTISPECIES: TraX family protein [Stenotrophomonas maltophilia group]|uniref:TraX family protein n=1 Tax=Stenotrophomonas maltophilia group TaxID=995085 RepID=UPI00209080D7|nr:TraX family protein [Stenotrophomonas maltophilia]MCO5735585.1 TraX family protein [Stenotrophomonas maltophilia]
MTSGGRELLKWLALVLMTGDHVLTVFGLGYVPVVSELGRVAFPVFALVMAYNLAQDGADAGKSARRLAAWGLVATPAAMLAFGQVLPLNVLFTFAAAAGCIWALERRQWALAALLGIVAPVALDYAWPGVWLVLAAWHWYRGRGGRPWLVWGCMGLVCAYNGNGWALLALPALRLAHFDWSIPRSGRAFYAYYVGHLALLVVLAAIVAA